MKARKIPGVVFLIFTSALSFEARSQACGYSINTMYVRDYEGRRVQNVSFRVARKDPNDAYNPHFQEASVTYWDAEREAYIYQHGMCGSHRELLLTISAPGFEPLEQAFNLPLGWQAFAITLKRKGTKEATIFKQLACTEDSNICVRTPYF